MKHLSLLLLTVLLVAGCTSTDLYKVAATTEAVTDNAMVVCGDYYRYAKGQPNPPPELERRRAEAEQLYNTYRTAMNAFYDGRKTAASNTPAQEKLLEIAQSSSKALIYLLNIWLPEPYAKRL